MKTYLVGGAVRDGLLDLPVKDHDWVVVHTTPAHMLQEKFLPVGKDFPVFLHPNTHEEYALARTERKTGEGYTGFECFTSPDVTIEEDLLRRDLTINAIAFDFDAFQKRYVTCDTPEKALAKFKLLLENNEINAIEYLIDPFLGFNDIRTKTLKHVSEAFKEDPLRVLRLARFYAQFYKVGFSVDKTTNDLIKLMVDNQELKSLTKERVWLETLKALNTDNPEIYFKYLQETGALSQIYPEFDISIDARALQYLENISKRSQSPQLRFAALLSSLLSNNQLTKLQDKKAFNQFLETLRISNDFKMTLWVACQSHHWKTLLTHSPEEIMALLTTINYPRQVDNLHDYIKISSIVALTQADTPENIEGLNKIKTQLLQDIHTEFEKIDTKKWIDEGLSGLEIKQALHSEKIQIINNILKQLKA